MDRKSQLRWHEVPSGRQIMKMEREYMNDHFGEKVRGDSSYDRNRLLGGGAVGSDTGWGVQAVHINNIVNGEIVVELGVAFGGRGGGAEVAGGFDVVAEAILFSHDQI
nr:hypothetical protein Iba_chr09eCG11680 [Ipomoea batatas]